MVSVNTHPVVANLLRGAAVTGFVGGLVSLWYGIQSEDRARWMFILLGLFLAVALGGPLLARLNEVLGHHRAFDGLLRELAVQSAQVDTLQQQVSEQSQQISVAHQAGLAEGRARAVGSFVSLMVELEPRGLDLLDGELVILAKPTTPDDGLREGRWTLRNVHSDSVLAVFAVARHETDLVLLAPVRHPGATREAWVAFSERSRSGDSLPPGLALTHSSFEDYLTNGELDND